MTDSAVSRWLEHVRLRSTSERDENAQASSRGTSGAARGVIGRRGSQSGRCFVSVSKRTASSPGAACSRYHARDGVELVQDTGIDRWEGDRWSIIAAPERPLHDMAEFAGRIITNLEDRHDKALDGSAWVHRDGAVPHVHIAIRSQSGLHLTEKGVGRAVNDALKAMSKSRGRTQSRGMSR